MRGMTWSGLVCSVLLLAGGCGSDQPELHPVTGSVTYEGEPLRYGTILFQPASGPLAVGEIGPDGTFSLISGELGPGAVAGTHRVSFRPPPRKFAVPAEELEAGPAPLVVEQPFLPSEYLSPETSPVTAEVEPEENALQIALPQGS